MAEKTVEDDDTVSGYELWDIDTRNTIGTATTYGAMLRLALEIIKANPEMSHDLTIGYSDMEGHYEKILEIKVTYSG